MSTDEVPWYDEEKPGYPVHSEEVATHIGRHTYEWTGRSENTCKVTDGHSVWCALPEEHPLHHARVGSKPKFRKDASSQQTLRERASRLFYADKYPDEDDVVKLIVQWLRDASLGLTSDYVITALADAAERDDR